MRLLLIVGLLAGCSGGGENQVIYQTVGAAPVRAYAEFSVERSFSGVVVPARSADMAFEFGGTVETVRVDEGDRVGKGELLAKLDTALLAAEERRLEAELQEAKANLRLADVSLDRHTSLESQGYASRQRRDEMEASRDAVRARVEGLHAALNAQRIRQQKSHLYSPFGGVVGERYLDDGASAVPGRAVLRLLESTRKEAHIGVPRRLASELKPGQKVDVLLGGDSPRSERISGEILAVGGELKARSHTATVRVGLPDTLAMATLTGSVARLLLRDNIDGPGFAIPQGALTASMRGLWRVYVLQPEENGLYRVEARDLQLRYSRDREVYVQGGLQDGELIISKGVHKVVPGQLVRLAAEGGEA